MQVTSSEDVQDVRPFDVISGSLFNEGRVSWRFDILGDKDADLQYILLVLGHQFVIWKSFYKQSPESFVCKCIGWPLED